jgi:hypothetical protein
MEVAPYPASGLTLIDVATSKTVSNFPTNFAPDPLNVSVHFQAASACRSLKLVRCRRPAHSFFGLFFHGLRLGNVWSVGKHFQVSIQIVEH